MGRILTAGLVCIIIACIGVRNNERDRELLSAEYSMLLLFAAGIFGLFILVGAVLLAAGKSGILLILSGFVGTILFELIWLKSSEVGPVKEWFRCTLWGIGKVTKFILYLSIIGIIPMRMIQYNLQLSEKLNKRAKAQYQKNIAQELRHQVEMEKIAKQAELEMMEKDR